MVQPINTMKMNANPFLYEISIMLAVKKLVAQLVEEKHIEHGLTEGFGRVFITPPC